VGAAADGYTMMASHSPAHVATAPATDACAGAVASPWSDAGVTTKLAKNTDAICFHGGVAPLGEAGKAAAVSECRFAHVCVQQGRQGCKQA
jgi:hypothetical protein